jgi:hypothetical protein
VGEGWGEGYAKPNFGSATSIFARDDMRVKHKSRSLHSAINNGVDSMTTILSLIYREYCRSCLLNYRYF